MATMKAHVDLSSAHLDIAILSTARSQRESISLLLRLPRDKRLAVYAPPKPIFKFENHAPCMP